MKDKKFRTSEKAVEEPTDSRLLEEEVGPEMTEEEMERIFDEEEEPEMSLEEAEWEEKAVEEYIALVGKTNPKRAEWLREGAQMDRLPIEVQHNFYVLLDSFLLYFFIGLFAWAEGYDVKTSGWLDNARDVQGVVFF